MFRTIDGPGSRPRRLALVLGFAGLLTLAGCANGSGNAAPATTASGPTPTAAVTSAPPVATSGTGTIAPVPQPSSTLSATPATPGSAGAAGGPSRVKEIQEVTTWWVATMKTRLHRTADPGCVTGIVSRLDRSDLALLAAAAKSGAAIPPGLSAAGNALGGFLIECMAPGGGLPGQETSSVPASSVPASAVQIPGAAHQCLLSSAEVSRLFDMKSKESTYRVHLGPLGTANGCTFENETSADHYVTVVLYAKIDPTKVKSFESTRTFTAKPIPNLGDAAYFSSSALDIVIGTRMISIEQAPDGDEEGLFAAAHLLLTRLK
ncbi:hypothetical protein ABIB25_001289 [Nakamurella sp. UYEF19]|uniref:hypothetical protein n=1 Tax=Nakamurella sp. UYEF19 TaxID=1756392 RepID=UPI0033952740